MFVAPDPHLTRPDLQGTFGMVASTHWLATASALSVLERGGNAADAAVSAGFVLHVVEPHLNGPGGDMTALIASPADPVPRVLMGQGCAPAAATIAHCRAEGLDRVPGTGALAAAVPLAVDAWLLLLAEHGTWELPEVLDHAIGYARDGHPVLARVAAQIASLEETFARAWPTSGALWMPDGRAPQPGELIRNPEYARVLQDLAEHAVGPTREARIEAARRRWREGPVARAIAAFQEVPHRHSDGAEHRGVMTAADLAGAVARLEPAATATFRGRTIAKTGPWGQGPALLIALRILDGFADEELDPSTEAGAHRILEALKLALADRDTHFGDGQDVPLAQMLSEEYIASRRALITERACAGFRPGRPGGRTGTVPPLLTAEQLATAGGRLPDAATGEPTVRVGEEVRGDTCHLDVVDARGMMISATPSGGWLQSSPAVPGIGFCLGTRLQMTWLDESSPTALRPGARPRTTLTPTLVLEHGQPVMALGSPGGDQQDQWQLLFLLRVLVGGYTPQQAIDAPALHTTAMPGSFWPRTWTPAGAVVEERLGEQVIAGLRERGHEVTVSGPWSLGRLSCVTRDPATGVLGAAANPRGAQGYAAGR
ncbi:gamma-glutamyltransferase family protein [Brachybacterium hainanense]|uniref:Gamma-glutamyltransferase family protein n=1 Tax=Brachybacterium hainanense TaxID=1541174 RepID=A0ABV6RA80_9MICO